MAKLPTMWKPPAVTGRGNHTVADAPRLCRIARFGRSEAVNPGDLSRVDGQRFRSSAPGDQNAPKRGRARASGKASKPETMRPFTRWKSSGERSQSVHSTESLPMQDGSGERGRESKARPREGNAGV